MGETIILPLSKSELTQLIKESVEEVLNSIQTEKSSTQNEDIFLNVNETANFLRLKPATIYTKVSKGQLPNMKRGNKLYFSKQALIEYLKQGKQLTEKEIEAIADNYINKAKS